MPLVHWSLKALNPSIQLIANEWEQKTGECADRKMNGEVIQYSDPEQAVLRGRMQAHSPLTGKRQKWERATTEVPEVPEPMTVECKRLTQGSQQLIVHPHHITVELLLLLV